MFKLRYNTMLAHSAVVVIWLFAAATTAHAEDEEVADDIWKDVLSGKGDYQHGDTFGYINWILPDPPPSG